MSVRINNQIVSGSIKGLVGTTAPTTSTAGVIGQIYIDTVANKQYICTSTAGGSFTWTEISGGGGSATNYDNITINLNNSDEMQTVGVIDNNSGNATFDWIGTLAEYEAGRAANPQTITDDMMCYITDDYDTPTDVVSDVQINGTSIVTAGVASIPTAGQDTLGVSKVAPTYGVTISNGALVGSTKTDTQYTSGANSLILCKGTLENIKTTLGPDVQINGTSILSSGVANIPIATSDSLGVVIPKNGLQVTAQGNLNVNKASDGQIDARINSYNPIVPVNLDYAVRSVKPLYTQIAPTTATQTLAINNTYGQAPTVAVTYTLPTVTALDNNAGIDQWVKMFIDTTNSASISFTTTDSKTISPNEISTIELGHIYLVVIQFNYIKNSWALFIKDVTV